jgi:hypothetical protein
MNNPNTLNPSCEIRVLPIEQLTPARYNPRRPLKPTDKAYRKLETSLREFGLVEPLIWNEQTGHVVGGHTRLAILKALGVKEVPVSVVNLDEHREKALNIVLNNQEAQGRYDAAKLADLLSELRDLPEMSLTGFEASMLRSLQMQPQQLPPTPEVKDQVTIILEMPQAVFEQVETRINDLVRDFDLVSHLQRS